MKKGNKILKGISFIIGFIFFIGGMGGIASEKYLPASVVLLIGLILLFFSLKEWIIGIVLKDIKRFEDEGNTWNLWKYLIHRYRYLYNRRKRKKNRKVEKQLKAEARGEIFKEDFKRKFRKKGREK